MLHRQSQATTKLRGVVIAGSVVVIDRRSSDRVGPAVALTNEDMVLRVAHRRRTDRRTQGDQQAQGRQERIIFAPINIRISFDAQSCLRQVRGRLCLRKSTSSAIEQTTFPHPVNLTCHEGRHPSFESELDCKIERGILDPYTSANARLTGGTSNAYGTVIHSRKEALWNGRCWRILLKKSFWGDEQKFLAPLMRLIGASRASTQGACVRRVCTMVVERELEFDCDRLGALASRA